MTWKTSRRAVIAGAALALALPAAAQTAHTELVYIGTQGSDAGQGVVLARFDAASGTLTMIGTAAEVARPTWVVTHPTKPLLYAVSETEAGQVLAFAIEPGGALRPLGSVASGGGGPTHLALDPASSTLFAAHYNSGHVTALPIRADGSLGPVASAQADTGSGPSPRQTGPHAHGLALDPSRRTLLAADLGADRVFLYRFDARTRALAANPATIAVPAGHGPRHLAFHPGGKLLFLMSELVPALRSYRWDAKRGTATLIQTVPTAHDTPEVKANGAELAVSRDGRFVYVSNRKEDVVVGYAVNARTGQIREIERIKTAKNPWSFGIDPSGRWLLVANQGAGTVSVFRRDMTTGKLTATDQSIAVAKPTSIAFALRR